MERKQIERTENGIRLFFQILKKYFFQLVMLNLFFILTCIPIFTIGPACKALTKVAMDLIRDNTMTPGMDYFKEFKTDFIKSALCGTILTFVLGMMIYAVVINLRTQDLETTMMAFVIVGIILILFLLAMIMYALNLSATIDLPTSKIWKNAALLVFLSPKQMITLLFYVVAPAILYCLVYEIVLLLFVMGYFLFAALISSINAWTIIKKFVVAKKETDE